MVLKSSTNSYRWNDSSLAAFIMIVLVLATAYFVAVGGWEIFRGVVAWTVIGAVALALVPLYLWVFWSQRHRHIYLDYHMLYLPLATWLVSTVLYKIVVWRLTKGAAFWLTYGWDKGLQNLSIEPSIVILISGVYLFRFAGLFGERWAMRLAVTTLIASALVAILFPPLGE